MRSVQLSFQTGTFTDTFILSLLLLCLKLAVVLPLTFYHSLCLSHTFSLSVSYRLSLSLSPALSLSCLFSLLHSPLSPLPSHILLSLTPTTLPPPYCSDEFTGFVFKLQANLDPRHRDRMAFIRVCSGET